MILLKYDTFLAKSLGSSAKSDMEIQCLYDSILVNQRSKSKETRFAYFISVCFWFCIELWENGLF